MGNEFKGTKINFYDFTATLKYYHFKSVVIELISNSRAITFQHYENFIGEVISDNALMLQDEENEDKPPISIAIEDIQKIVEGIGANIDSYVIYLKNKLEIFIHRS